MYVAISVFKVNVAPNAFVGFVDITVDGKNGVKRKKHLWRKPVNAITFGIRAEKIYREYIKRGYEIDFTYRSLTSPFGWQDIDLSSSDHAKFPR